MRLHAPAMSEEVGPYQTPKRIKVGKATALLGLMRFAVFSTLPVRRRL